MSEPQAAAGPKPRRSKRRSEARSEAANHEPVRLAADLGIDQAASLHAELSRRLDEADPVLVNAAEVQRLHTAPMQLLVMFCADRRRAGRDVRWQHPSTAFRSAAELLGVTSLLQITREPA